MKINININIYVFVEAVGEAMHTCDLKLAQTLVWRLAMRMGMGMMVCLCHDWVGGGVAQPHSSTCL